MDSEPYTGRRNNLLAQLQFAHNGELLKAIYSSVVGTEQENAKQLMDFVSGYRLIHIQELENEYNNVVSVVEGRELEFDTLIPIPANYSSDFYCVGLKDGKEQIVDVMHDFWETDIMHNSGEDFLRTLCTFYEENVYFLDKMGILAMIWSGKALWPQD